MPSRMQRRRREKSFRHEYEYVYVDDEGRDVEPDAAVAVEAPVDARVDTPAKPTAAKKRDEPRKRAASAPARAGRRGVEPPSWRRTLRRAAVLTPFMFIMVYVLNRDYSPVQNAVTTVTLLLVFVPFSYLLDSVMWRAFQRREARAGGKTGPTKTSGRRARS